MQLDNDAVAAPVTREPTHRTLHPADDGLGGEHTASTVAHLAGFRHRVKMALPHPLARHLDQSKVAHRERLGAGSIAAEVHAQLLQHAVAIGLRLHVDEVADDDAAHVTESQLSRDLARGLHVRLGDRLLGILLAGVPARVHVDRDERLGRFDDQVAAARQVAATLEEVADLRLDAELVEQRDRFLVEMHAVDEFRRDALEVLDHLVVHLLRVHREAVHLGGEQVADDAAGERRLPVQQLGRVTDELGLLVDAAPLRDQRLELAREGVLRDVLADGPHDHAARILGQHLLHLLAEPLALGALADLPAHAHA